MLQGYREDFLTLRALTVQRDILFKNISKDLGYDSKQLKMEIIFYRPSLGRGNSIGEFDAIIVTKNHVLIIESKFDQAVGCKKGIKLDEAQINRHRKFRKCFELATKLICEEKKDLNEITWEMFREKLTIDSNFAWPKTADRLWPNLKYIFEKCFYKNTFKRGLVDILLFFVSKRTSAELQLRRTGNKELDELLDKMKIVRHEYDDDKMYGAGFFSLSEEA